MSQVIWQSQAAHKYHQSALLAHSEISNEKIWYRKNEKLFDHQHKQRRGQVADHPESVATTWSLSFTRVEQTNPAAADLLRCCAFLAPDAIPEELFTEGARHLGPILTPVTADSFLLNQALEALLAYSLLQRDATSRTLSVHRLVQAVLQDTMAEHERKRWVEQAVQAVNAAMRNTETKPSSRPTTLRAWSHHRERYLPHLRACAKLVSDWHVVSSEAVELLDRFAHELSSSLESYNIDEIIDALHKAVRMWEEVRGSDDLHIVDCLSLLIIPYKWQRREDEVRELSKRISIIEQRTDPEVFNAFPFRTKIMSGLNPPDQFTS